jgi:hypothetical protein
MARSISCVTRKTNLIGLVVPERPGKIGFRFSFAVNFDAAFTALQVVPNHGFRSVSVPPTAFGNGTPFKNQVGFIFRPSDYTATIPAMIDGIPLYLRVEAQNPSGTFDSPEAMHLVLPNRNDPNAPFMLRGTVPNAANLAASLEIQLPGRNFNWRIKVDGGSNLEVALDPGGPEYVVLPEPTTGRSYEQVYSSISQLFLRGAGGTSNISSTFTLGNAPIC